MAKKAARASTTAREISIRLLTGNFNGLSREFLTLFERINLQYLDYVLSVLS
jgi:hypothetical protein